MRRKEDLCRQFAGASAHPEVCRCLKIKFPAKLHDERQRKQRNDYCNTVHMEHQNLVQCPKNLPLHEKQRGYIRGNRATATFPLMRRVIPKRCRRGHLLGTACQGKKSENVKRFLPYPVEIVWVGGTSCYAYMRCRLLQYGKLKTATRSMRYSVFIHKKAKDFLCFFGRKICFLKKLSAVYSRSS